LLRGGPRGPGRQGLFDDLLHARRIGARRLRPLPPGTALYAWYHVPGRTELDVQALPHRAGGRAAEARSCTRAPRRTSRLGGAALRQSAATPAPSRARRARVEAGVAARQRTAIGQRRATVRPMRDLCDRYCAELSSSTFIFHTPRSRWSSNCISRVTKKGASAIALLPRTST